MIGQHLANKLQEIVRLLRLGDKAGRSQLEGQSFVLRVGVGRRVEDEGDRAELRVGAPGAAEAESLRRVAVNILRFGLRRLPSDRMTSIAGLSGLTDRKEHR